MKDKNIFISEFNDLVSIKHLLEKNGWVISYCIYESEDDFDWGDMI